MIKKYLCKNDDLRYFDFLNLFVFIFFGLCVFCLGCFYVSGLVIHLLASFILFAFCVLFGCLCDNQFKKVYKLKKEKECEKSGK